MYVGLFWEMCHTSARIQFSCTIKRDPYEIVPKWPTIRDRAELWHICQKRPTYEKRDPQTLKETHTRCYIRDPHWRPACSCIDLPSLYDVCRSLLMYMSLFWHLRPIYMTREPQKRPTWSFIGLDTHIHTHTRARTYTHAHIHTHTYTSSKKDLLSRF